MSINEQNLATVDNASCSECKRRMSFTLAQFILSETVKISHDRELGCQLSNKFQLITSELAKKNPTLHNAKFNNIFLIYLLQYGMKNTTFVCWNVKSFNPTDSKKTLLFVFILKFMLQNLSLVFGKLFGLKFSS